MSSQTKKTKKEQLASRPPVVVVLGHVDHGKSSILEAVKDFKITEKESGGITQHIGAYEIGEEGKKITFIDTPGHEAFSAMRSRGAKVADIAVLVVAGDEGVKPQTKEAISHIKESNIPMVVAINKMDKPQADAEKTKRELSQAGVTCESMGGKVPSVEVSALQRAGISELLDILLLVAEMENLKTSLSAPAQGVIVESYLDSKRGPTATLILTQGVLKKGDVIATASALGKAKILKNFQGKDIPEALPSQPVILLGFENVPRVGEQFKEFSSVEQARQSLSKEAWKKAEDSFAATDKQVLNLILKADVLGSVEAIEQVLKSLPQEKVFLRILKKEVGEINESDIKLAKSGRAGILGFRVKVDSVARVMAERERVRIKTFEVIYDLSQYVRERMEKIFRPKTMRIDIGKLKTLLVFRTEKKRQIVGGKIIEGKAERGAKIEIFRGEEKVGTGKMLNLQKNKKDIVQAKKGEEAGILYEGDAKIEEGDILLFYTEQKEKSEL